MIEEKKEKRNFHNISLENREKLSISGVSEVLSFDEDSVIMETSFGLLLIKGVGLHMGKLDLMTGEVTVEGIIENIGYSDNISTQKQGIFGKLFR
ncbi:MAG: sporulation protein YabP [Bacillota bacterium]